MTPDQPKNTLSPAYFEAIYAQNPDPWDFETKPYEHEKYRATLENLPRERYKNALELGCSIGVLSVLLASRCEKLLSLDVAENALQNVRKRCAELPNVEFLRANLPDEFPAGNFDLILMSEVGYYFALPDLERLQTRIWSALEAGGDLVLVHYLPFVADYPLSGDAVHEAFLQNPKWTHSGGFRAARFRFDAFRKA